jgi:hypothetical protein
LTDNVDDFLEDQVPEPLPPPTPEQQRQEQKQQAREAAARAEIGRLEAELVTLQGQGKPAEWQRKPVYGLKELPPAAGGSKNGQASVPSTNGQSLNQTEDSP